MLFMFHPEKAPEGQLFQSAADVPPNEGWVETPDAFKPDYKKPVPVVPRESVPENRPDYVPVKFPAYRFKDGEEKLVASQAEADALGPGWSESPKPAAPAAAAAPAPKPPTPAELDPLKVQAEKEELFALPVKGLGKVVAEQNNPDTLRKMRQYEAENPSGTRKGVLDLIDARLKELGA